MNLCVPKIITGSNGRVGFPWLGFLGGGAVGYLGKEDNGWAVGTPGATENSSNKGVCSHRGGSCLTCQVCWAQVNAERRFLETAQTMKQEATYHEHYFNTTVKAVLAIAWDRNGRGKKSKTKRRKKKKKRLGSKSI